MPSVLSGASTAAQGSSVRVTPTAGDFADVEPGSDVFVLPFTIHNVSNRVKRVRFVPPVTSAFRLISAAQSIAPGMKQTVEVEFSSSVVQEHHDAFVVRTEEGDINIPLRAWFPAPNLQAPALVDLGRVSAQHPVEAKKFRLRNTGKKEGTFKFVIDAQQAAGLSVTPSTGTVMSGEELDVAVNFFPSEVGVLRSQLLLHVDGQHAKSIDVNADVVESRVGLVESTTGQALSRVQFGKLYFGQRRQTTAVLRNDGQHPVSFTVKPPEISDEETAQAAFPMMCHPTEGRLGANESIPIVFTFAPALQEAARGWEHSKIGGESRTFDWDSAFTVEVVETEQRLEIQLLGRALCTEVSISSTKFQFPAVSVYDRADIMCTLTNESQELPLVFSTSRVAQFQVTPASGKIPPCGEANIIVTFHPNQLGSFRGVVKLDVNNGAKVIPLSVSGAAAAIGARSALVGGVDKLASDFERPRKFVNPADDALPPPREGTPTMDDDAEGEEDILLMSEWEQKQAHNNLYSKFVTQCREVRQLNNDMRRGIMTDANPADIGMVPSEGIAPPEPRPTRREAPLPFAAAEAGDGKKGDQSVALRKAMKVDENKPIKKKFRREPATLNEMRECKLVLSPKDIQQVGIPLKVLDFQQVSVYSTNTKSFFVFNGLKTHIWVNIPHGIREELALSSPLSQVIPPGQLAGFDVVFHSETPQMFQQAIYFTLNDTHRLKFVVFAEAVPLDVSLSHSELIFRFPDFGLEPAVTMPVTIVNNGNSDAEFSWLFPEQEDGEGQLVPAGQQGGPQLPFMFHPSTGVVPANGSLTVDVAYTPLLASNETQVQAQLKVKGGAANKRLLLSGSVPAAQCTWSVRDGRLDFKKVPVGAVRAQSITIRNHGASSTVFAFDVSQLAPGITVSPTRGRISAGGQEEVQVQLRATVSQSIRSPLTCHVRGMKQLLKLNVTAEAKIPEFHIIDPPEVPGADARIDFGGVYVGGTELRKVVLQSNDDVPASFTVDLTQYPAFALCDGERRPVDRVVTDGDELPPAPGAGQIVALRASYEDEPDVDMVPGDELRRGTAYRIVLNPKQSLSFYFAFTPVEVGEMEPFLLPISLHGTDVTSPNLRPVMATAEGKKPRLVLSPSTVDFGARVVVRDGTSKVPNRVLVKVSNETDDELVWDFESRTHDTTAEVFRVEPMSGRLQPGQTSQVQFTFTPVEVRSYTARYAVFLDNEREQKYTDIIVKGFGANPSLTFDRKEVILPAVPVDVPARMTFFVANEGYESLDLRYKIVGDGKLPLALAFPEGQTITSNHALLPVEVTFHAKKAMTFTVNIDFFDDDEGIFSVPVTCTADNSLLTTFGYLRWRDSGVTIAAEGDRKPVMLREIEDAPIDKDTLRSGGPVSGARSDISATAQGTEEGINPFAPVDTIHKKTLSRRALDRLRVWLNVHVLPEPVDDLVASLQMNRGRLMIDIIELLFGKAPALPRIGQAGAPEKKQTPAPPGRQKKDTTAELPAELASSGFVEVDHFDSVLLFLKQYGASVCDVRSEFLLRYDEYCRIVAEGGPRTALPQLGKSRSPARLSERRFAFRALHAWTTVVYQALRVFYFSRITWKAFKASPPSPVMSNAAILEKWGAIGAEPSSAGSNLYSVPEGLLLKWLSLHATAVFGQTMPTVAQPARPGAALPSMSVPGGGIRVTNFEQDLRDCRAFCACLQSYIPSIAARFDPEKDGGVAAAPTTAVEYERNAMVLLDAMKEHGMDMRTTPRDLLDHTARENLLFAAYLFNALPQYVPKTTVKFKGKLQERITKSIELTNPTKHPIDYTVSIDGCDDFKLGDSVLHLEPKATGNFNISVIPRFTRRIDARVTFLSSRAGTFAAATMVFGLETEVDPESALKTIDTLETPMYEAINHEVVIDNPFTVSGNFTLSVQQEYLRGLNTKPIAEEESLHQYSDAFWTQTDSITLKKNDKARFTLQFLPFVRGKYKTRIVFRDEKVGEFAYVFIGTCLPPRPSEVIGLQTEAASSVQREVLIPGRNVALEKATQLREERFRMFKGRARKDKDSDSDSKDATYKVEFLNDKFVGPNPFFSGPKAFTLRTAAADDDDDSKSPKKRSGRDGKESRAPAPSSSTAQSHPLAFSFNPRGPGTYNCFVMLTSAKDVRVLMIEGKSRAPGMRAELEFSCPARQQISQEIPITNGSDKDWLIAAQLTGEYFAGPRELRVPAGKTRSYTLNFNPAWMCDVQGQLVLRNNETQEKVTYTLTGDAQEPLAENTIAVECKARETKKIIVNVPNITFEEVTYTVETDLPFVSGPSRITVNKMEVGRYPLTVSPQLSGKATGSITFNTPSKQYVWFVINANTLRPPPEDKVTITSEVRQGVVADIGISNPTDRQVDFTVRRRGEGLIGDDIVTLGPSQKASYQLAFAPTRAGETEGAVSFNNDDIGEFWYRLGLVAKEAAPTPLAFQCELGKSMAVEATLENPTDHECTLQVQSSNDVNFTVTPNVLVMKPQSVLKFSVAYMPSAIQVPQEARLTLSHTKVGKWEYACQGIGLPPTQMEPVACTSQVGRTSSCIVTFRNPFPVPKRFAATLQLPEDGLAALETGPPPFTLLSKKQQQPVLGPFQTMQVPLGYLPQSIAQHRATVVVQLVEQADAAELRWEFPVHGTAEHQSTDAPIRLSTKARRATSMAATLPLAGIHPDAAATETFVAEVNVPRDTKHRSAALSSVTVTRAPAKTSGSSTPTLRATVDFDIEFQPLRPFAVAAELVVRRSTGGAWRFAMQLDAQPPEVDDTIVIEAAVNVVETVAFPLYNVVPAARPFVAYFTSESPPEFTVSPAKGTLPPMATAGSDPKAASQRIEVGFTSSQYGKTLAGVLVVETEEMQWRYEVRGTLPKYQPPTVSRSRVDNRLRPETLQSMKRNPSPAAMSRSMGSR